MADAMKSPWQDMQHEAADELIRGECHDLLLVGLCPAGRGERAVDASLPGARPVYALDNGRIHRT